MSKLVKLVIGLLGLECQTCELGYGLHWDSNFFFFQNNFLFNYIMTKIDNCEIKHQPNINIFFWDWDNLTKGETKPVIKLNSQLTQYLRMKLKKE